MFKGTTLVLHSVCSSVPQLPARQNELRFKHARAYLGQEIPVVEQRVERVEVITVVARIGNVGAKEMAQNTFDSVTGSSEVDMMSR